MDESAYSRTTDCGLRNAVYSQRTQLGWMGAPYDLYDMFDFEAVYRRYKAVLFASACPTERMRRARALCEADGVPYLSLSEDKQQFCAAELREFCRKNGVHIYCETDDTVYVNRHYLAVHATQAGVKRIAFEGVHSFRELLTENGLRGRAALLTVPLRKNETKLFEITEYRMH